MFDIKYIEVKNHKLMYNHPNMNCFIQFNQNYIDEFHCSCKYLHYYKQVMKINVGCIHTSILLLTYFKTYPYETYPQLYQTEYAYINPDFQVKDINQYKFYFKLLEKTVKELKLFLQNNKTSSSGKKYILIEKCLDIMLHNGSLGTCPNHSNGYISYANGIYYCKGHYDQDKTKIPCSYTTTHIKRIPLHTSIDTFLNIKK